jgi:hypothetical protein
LKARGNLSESELDFDHWNEQQFLQQIRGFSIYLASAQGIKKAIPSGIKIRSAATSIASPKCL